METQYIYLLQEREFIKTKETIYKIGKTKQNNNDRLKQYPKGSTLLLQIVCCNCDNSEKNLIKIFKNKYKHCKQIGNEYFDGDSDDMIKTICNNIINDINVKLQSTVNDISSFNVETNNIEINNSDIDENDESDEDDDEDENVEITTYDELKKIIDIDKIIITNKNTLEGYIKFPGYLYRKLHNKYSPNFIKEEMEDLGGYINNFKEKNYCGYKYDDKIINQKIYEQNLLNPNFRGNINYINLIYNEEKLIKDIIHKCYVKTPIYYKLKYHEYIVHCNGSYKGCKIFDSDKKTLNDTENYSELGIIEPKYSSVLHINNENISDIGISIVEKILNRLIIDTPKINQYKNLCYSVLVKPTNLPIVFYDNHTFTTGLLTTFLRDVCYNLKINYLYSSDYYKDVLNCKKLIKQNNIKLVIITFHNRYSLEKMVGDFIKLGIKNIIVNNKVKVETSIYSFVEKHSCDNICDNIHFILKEMEDEILVENPKNIHFDYDIFSSNTQLGFNFILWCCSL
jgi:hypothetical protein